jgi:hypothetical protein
MKCSTPCTQCRKDIVIDLPNPNINPSTLFKQTGAIWDRGWFCSADCRDAFNLHAPQGGWDRALEGLKEKPKA